MPEAVSTVFRKALRLAVLPLTVFYSSLVCHYSLVGRLGKPKGSRNKKTIEKERLNSVDGKYGTGTRAEQPHAEQRAAPLDPNPPGNRSDGGAALELYPGSETPSFWGDLLQEGLVDSSFEGIPDSTQLSSDRTVPEPLGAFNASNEVLVVSYPWQLP